MRVADIDMTRHKENCPTGFREAVSVPASAHMELNIVECVGESLDISLDEQMHFWLIIIISDLLTPTFLMALY